MSSRKRGCGLVSRTKNRCYLIRLSILFVSLTLVAGMMACDSTSDYLEIRDWHDLYAIKSNLAGHYLLMNDLDSTTAGYMEFASKEANQGKGWQPIGTSTLPFRGSFDGQGHEIRDVFVNRRDGYLVGLFGTVSAGGVILNVNVVNATVVGEWAVGVLVGENRGQVRKSCSTGTVTGQDSVGGLVGRNVGALSNCYSTANVTGHWDVGGLVGSADSSSTVSNSYSTGSVTGEWAVGGLVGGNLGGTVTRSYSTSRVEGDDYVGGLVGDNQGSVSNSYSTARVTGEWYVGGLVGDNDSTGVVTNCYASGSVTGLSFVGGLVGSNWGAVSNSFWNIQTSGVSESDGGTGKSTTAMNDIATYLNAGWNIVSVASGQTNPAYIWNIVSGQTHPFLSWQPID